MQALFIARVQRQSDMFAQRDDPNGSEIECDE
jgi:hypothetical protein